MSARLSIARTYLVLFVGRRRHNGGRVVAQIGFVRVVAQVRRIARLPACRPGSRLVVGLRFRRIACALDSTGRLLRLEEEGRQILKDAALP